MAHDAQQASAMHRRYSANIPEATLDVGENVFSSQDSRRMFGDIFGDASGSTYDEMYTRDWNVYMCNRIPAFFCLVVELYITIYCVQNGGITTSSKTAIDHYRFTRSAEDGKVKIYHPPPSLFRHQQSHIWDKRESPFWSWSALMVVTGVWVYENFIYTKPIQKRLKFATGPQSSKNQNHVSFPFGFGFISHSSKCGFSLNYNKTASCVVISLTNPK